MAVSAKQVHNNLNSNPKLDPIKSHLHRTDEVIFAGVGHGLPNVPESRGERERDVPLPWLSEQSEPLGEGGVWHSPLDHLCVCVCVCV